MTPEEYLSLREIGRRLNIPPSTVVYYKDRFASYIPHHGENGRRKKYPSKALTIFKEIREMFDSNWSAEQIEQTLSNDFDQARVAKAYRDSRNDGSNHRPEPDGIVHEISGVLGKMSSLLENQALFRSEIDSLRAEITTLKEEKQAMERRYLNKIDVLEKEVHQLRLERSELMDKFTAYVEQGKTTLSPPKNFLNLPLVIKTDQNEYLGVAGKTKHFSLNEFIRIINKNGANKKHVTMDWQKESKQWVLTIRTNNKQAKLTHEHVLKVLQTVTPSKNSVVQLTNLVIDGNSVPEPFLLVLFRKIKDGFDA